MYYRNKIYSDEEKEMLWLNKLNKNERWIMGEKVDISKNENRYFELLKFYQQKNKRLGYGNPDDWETAGYKRERKLLKKSKKK